jgi:hypothetical protein
MTEIQNRHDIGAELGSANLRTLAEPVGSGNDLQHLRFAEKPALDAATQSLAAMGLDKACLLGLFVPPDQTLVMEPGCNWHLRPATEAEKAAREAERRYRESPEYKRKEEEIFKHMVD